MKIVAKYIKDFDVISVREKTGIDIVKSMGRDDVILAPDPTLLQQPQFYHVLADECKVLKNSSYIYSFFIRHIVDRKRSINKIFKGKPILWNSEDGDYTMQGWLSKIKHADFVVTDSFHCVVMCLKLHKPFAVVTPFVQQAPRPESHRDRGRGRKFRDIGQLAADRVIPSASRLPAIDRRRPCEASSCDDRPFLRRSPFRTQCLLDAVCVHLHHIHRCIVILPCPFRKPQYPVFDI